MDASSFQSHATRLTCLEKRQELSGHPLATFSAYFASRRATNNISRCPADVRIRHPDIPQSLNISQRRISLDSDWRFVKGDAPGTEQGLAGNICSAHVGRQAVPK